MANKTINQLSPFTYSGTETGKSYTKHLADDDLFVVYDSNVQSIVSTNPQYQNQTNSIKYSELKDSVLSSALTLAKWNEWLRNNGLSPSGGEGSGGVSIEIVDQATIEGGSGSPNVIYLVKNEAQGRVRNVYDEYIFVEETGQPSRFEKITDTGTVAKTYSYTAGSNDKYNSSILNSTHVALSAQRVNNGTTSTSTVDILPTGINLLGSTVTAPTPNITSMSSSAVMNVESGWNLTALSCTTVTLPANGWSSSAVNISNVTGVSNDNLVLVNPIDLIPYKESKIVCTNQSSTSGGQLSFQYYGTSPTTAIRVNVIAFPNKII